MIRSLDGPAAETTLQLARTPILLRVVVGRLNGKVDALDQLDDQAEADEAIYVYRLVGEPMRGFVDGTRGGRRCGRPFVSATYRLHEPQPDEGLLRDNALWREWCEAVRYEVLAQRAMEAPGS